jgi:hypothetical protein
VMRVVLVSFRELGRGGGGKLTPRFFVPIFGQVLREYGIGLDECWEDELRQWPDRYRNQFVILVYREVSAQTNVAFGSKVEETERIARENNMIVLHGIELGRLIADKTRTNRALGEAGISVPKLVTENTARFEVFSNENAASHAAAFVHDTGAELDLQRYNTAYIDTTQYYAGQVYYVVVRAMSVGTKCVSITVRARATSEGDPSVHGTDTPLDVGLLNHLYEKIVLPRKKAIIDVCEAIGTRLGLAFYSHDILPCNASDHLYVCETGFKFDNSDTRTHLAPLADSIPFNDHVAAAIRSSHAFVGESRKLGYL